jgi:hypothetical protein
VLTHEKNETKNSHATVPLNEYSAPAVKQHFPFPLCFDFFANNILKSYRCNVKINNFALVKESVLYI